MKQLSWSLEKRNWWPPTLALTQVNSSWSGMVCALHRKTSDRNWCFLARSSSLKLVKSSPWASASRAPCTMLPTNMADGPTSLGVSSLGWNKMWKSSRCHAVQCHQGAVQQPEMPDKAIYLLWGKRLTLKLWAQSTGYSAYSMRVKNTWPTE